MKAKFTVVWHRDAISDLAEIWVEAIDRNALAQACNSIDEALARSPETSGSDLSEGLRVVVQPPLQILFICRDLDRTVEVVRVKLI